MITDIPTLATQFRRSPMAYIGPRGRGTGWHLPQTTALLEAIRLTAQSELAANNVDPARIGNPIDTLLTQTTDPLINRFRTAIEAALTEHAFDTPNDTSETTGTRTFQPGDRVRLGTRPAPRVGLPTYILVGETGTLHRRQSFAPDGDGWHVEFDAHGLWWTTTDTLELL